MSSEKESKLNSTDLFKDLANATMPQQLLNTVKQAQEKLAWSNKVNELGHEIKRINELIDHLSTNNVITIVSFDIVPSSALRQDDVIGRRSVPLHLNAWPGRMQDITEDYRDNLLEYLTEYRAACGLELQKLLK